MLDTVDRSFLDDTFSLEMMLPLTLVSIRDAGDKSTWRQRDLVSPSISCSSLSIKGYAFNDGALGAFGPIALTVA
jgi:hypothetical protein